MFIFNFNIFINFFFRQYFATRFYNFNINSALFWFNYVYFGYTSIYVGYILDEVKKDQLISLMMKIKKAKKIFITGIILSIGTHLSKKLSKKFKVYKTTRKSLNFLNENSRKS